MSTRKYNNFKVPKMITHKVGDYLCVFKKGKWYKCINKDNLTNLVVLNKDLQSHISKNFLDLHKSVQVCMRSGRVDVMLIQNKIVISTKNKITRVVKSDKKRFHRYSKRLKKYEEKLEREWKEVLGDSDYDFYENSFESTEVEKIMVALNKIHYTRMLSSSEKYELSVYYILFTRNKFKEHWEVNAKISSDCQWDQFKSIRSLNTHSNGYTVAGITPQYFSIICKLLAIKGDLGSPLVDYEVY